MKRILIFILSFSIMACSETTQHNKIRTDFSNTEKFVLDFSKNNSNWSQNEIINNETDRKFTKSLISFYKTDTAFKNQIFKLTSTGKSPIGYVAKFENVKENISDTRNINIEVVGIISKKMANQLKSDSTYYIKGNFIRFLKNDIADISPDVSNNISIGFEPLIDSTYFLGAALFTITKVSRVKE